MKIIDTHVRNAVRGIFRLDIDYWVDLMRRLDEITPRAAEERWEKL